MTEEQTYTIDQFIKKYGTLDIVWYTDTSRISVIVNNNNMAVYDLSEKVATGYMKYMDGRWRLHGKFTGATVVGNDKLVAHYYNGVRHHDHKPAIKVYDENNQKIKEYYLYKEQSHRDDGPATIVYKKGIIVRSVWCTRGQKHRLNGPALMLYYDDGTVKYEEWYYYGDLHREDGPAITSYDINGNIITTKYYHKNKKQECLVTKAARA